MAGVAKRLLPVQRGPRGCALAALWASAGERRSPTSNCSRRHARARRRRPPRRGRRREELGRRRLRQAALGQRRRRFPGPARSSATSTSSGSRNSPGRCRRRSSARCRAASAPRPASAKPICSFRPMRGSKIAFSARAGLMWPPVSLEHEGADWHVKDSITPSAINSWIGEEVRPVAARGHARGRRSASTSCARPRR